MSALKPLTTADIVVTPFPVNKTFTFTAAEFTSSDVGIDRYLGTNPSGLFSTSNAVTGLLTSSYTVYQESVYKSVEQLYYSNYISSSYRASGSYDNFLQSSNNDLRFFPTASNANIAVITIPSKLYGEYIVPSTFTFTSGAVTLVDDGEGNVTSGGVNYGNIIYPHGVVIITTGSATVNIQQLVSSTAVTCSFQSAYTIYETQVKCDLESDEYNYSYNPSLWEQTGSVYGFATASYFAPYITTIGLYNENQELLMVAKASQPIPKSSIVPMSILVNIDR